MEVKFEYVITILGKFGNNFELNIVSWALTSAKGAQRVSQNASKGSVTYREPMFLGLVLDRLLTKSKNMQLLKTSNPYDTHVASVSFVRTQVTLMKYQKYKRKSSESWVGGRGGWLGNQGGPGGRGERPLEAHFPKRSFHRQLRGGSLETCAEQQVGISSF